MAGARSALGCPVHRASSFGSILAATVYRRHTRKVLFMLDAIENNDTAIHFSETDRTEDNRLVNRSLNRVARILHNVKSETAQQEKYYELILDCVNTGILVLNDNGAVYQKNNEALRLLGLEVFTHVSQLSRVDAHLTDTLTAMPSRRQVPGGRQRTRHCKPICPRQRHHRTPRAPAHPRLERHQQRTGRKGNRFLDTPYTRTDPRNNECRNPHHFPERYPVGTDRREYIKRRGTSRAANHQFHGQGPARFCRILP